jgi:hypothetical protein
MSENVSEYANLEDLVQPVEATEDVEIGGGRKVKVRGLTRYELLLSAKGTDDGALVERRNLVTCVVEPKLTLAAAEKWQKSSPPNVIGKVTDAIRRLSGLAEGAQKSDVSGDGERRA